MKWKNIGEEGAAFSLILLWVYAATDKLLHIQLFRFRLDSYPLIGHFSAILSWGVPLIELGIAALLISGRRRGVGFSASFLLLIVFTAYLGWMVATQNHLPCSCGGVIQHLTWKQHLILNFFFIAVAATGILCRRNKYFSSSKQHVYET
jgi:hypothetical protein